MRRVYWFCACLSLLSTYGCAICASPHDCKYAAYGGKRERADHVHGRVASVFDPALEVSRAGQVGQSGPQSVDLESLPPAEEAESSQAKPDRTPSVMPEGKGSSPETEPSTPRDSERPLDLPPGPETPEGESLPELPNGDSIELPEMAPSSASSRNTRGADSMSSLPLSVVTPVHVEFPVEACTNPLRDLFNDEDERGLPPASP